MASFFNMTWSWREWHRAYDTPSSPLSRRLMVVQQLIADALDAAPPGQIRVISMCAGEARDILGVLETHPRRADVVGRLVELDPVLAERARANAPAGIDVLCGDAGLTDSYDGAVPADIVLMCGVFGNITEHDLMRSIEYAPMLCAPSATLLWTRHRREPDATPGIRRHFTEQGFEEIDFVAPADTIFGVGAGRFRGTTPAFRPHERMYQFVGFAELNDACPQCGFSYAIGRTEVLQWLRSDTDAFVDRLAQAAFVRTRPRPDVWSPLEYACHVRDVLRVQRERIEQVQHEHQPHFTPMRRDERVIEDRYNEQDPAVVVGELRAASDALINSLETLDDAGWTRAGVYNYPEPRLRTVEWIAVHTDHELLHHRVDIGTDA